MIISGAVISNGDRRIDFFIENKVPLLRQKDIMREDQVDSPARLIYFTIQLMYIDQENLVTHHNAYWKLVQDFLRALPTALGLIDRISEKILSNSYYQALKLARKLIDYEKEVLNRVQGCHENL